MNHQNSIIERYHALHTRIAQAAQDCGRRADEIRLLAVSKGCAADALRAAQGAGQDCFGESYLNEALDKIIALSDLAPEWHYIGPLQSNKTRPIAAHFTWLHSLDRLKHAQRLNAQRPAALPPMNVCIQVNISDEASKSGVPLDELERLAQAVSALPQLRLRGLMAIPATNANPDLQRAAFRRVRLALEDLNTHGLNLDTLSMGMSDDLEAAIAEGATIVRVGSALFGARD